jgi:hypothetical protein
MTGRMVMNCIETSHLSQLDNRDETPERQEGGSTVFRVCAKAFEIVGYVL